MLPSAYNNDYQIVQAPGMVAIDTEMVHDVRRIPTDGSPHLPSERPRMDRRSARPLGRRHAGCRQHQFHRRHREESRGADKNLHLIERFTRVGPDILLYQFTVDDPTAFTKPWSGEIPMTKTDGLLYEYACHEGNIGMRDIIAAARADEKKAAGQAAKKN